MCLKSTFNIKILQKGNNLNFYNILISEGLTRLVCDCLKYSTSLNQVINVDSRVIKKSLVLL